MYEAIKKELRRLSNREHAASLQRYFKTGKGEYGEGDRFLGIKIPVLRKLAKEYQGISIREISELIKSRFHEERMLSLLLLVDIFRRASEKDKKTIYAFYFSHTKYINNWDLVDVSAGKIVGAYLLDRDKKQLYLWAESKNLWKRRISIISTSYFISHHKFADTLNIAEMLLGDEEDLIHKAVGWMLREVGQRDLELEEEFLRKHCRRMPRTMLRYAIEKFPERKRKSYLQGKPGNAGVSPA
jgi:3-methyladenine DNA glycosylase AlkD